MLPGSGTLALLAYSSQEGLTGTNMTWRGESHSGLVEEEPENQVFTLTPNAGIYISHCKGEWQTKSSSNDELCWREDECASVTGRYTGIESFGKMHSVSQINVHV